MKHLFLVLVAFFSITTTTIAQDINKTWQFDAIENETNESLFEIKTSDSLTFSNGEFNYNLAAKNVTASGDYIHQNNLLVFYYSQPTDTIRRYKITELTDSTLVFTQKNVHYLFKVNSVEKEGITTIAASANDTPAIIPSQGFTFQSFWRGVLGMITLVLIAFLFSSNRRAVNWKTVGCRNNRWLDQ